MLAVLAAGDRGLATIRHTISENPGRELPRPGTDMAWRKLNPETLTSSKLDAIHRAVLTGLLGNIGAKTDANEYTGARGTKFYLFPGSGLFKRSPKWVMAAELVETTRLYARTCARIQPE